MCATSRSAISNDAHPATSIARGATIRPDRSRRQVSVIDPAAFGGGDVYASRFEALARMIETDTGARLPGQRRIKLRETAAKSGLAVDAKLLAQASALAGE